MKKISNIFLWIFGIGVTLCVLAGGLTLLGFIVAMCIGGETATKMCVFIHKELFPWIIQFTSIFTGFGLLGMYFGKTKSLTVSSDKKEEEPAESKN